MARLSKAKLEEIQGRAAEIKKRPAREEEAPEDPTPQERKTLNLREL